MNGQAVVVGFSGQMVERISKKVHVAPLPHRIGQSLYHRLSKALVTTSALVAGVRLVLSTAAATGAAG